MLFASCVVITVISWLVGLYSCVRLFRWVVVYLVGMACGLGGSSVVYLMWLITALVMASCLIAWRAVVFFGCLCLIVFCVSLVCGFVVRLIWASGFCLFWVWVLCLVLLLFAMRCFVVGWTSY